MHRSVNQLGSWENMEFELSTGLDNSHTETKALMGDDLIVLLFFSRNFVDTVWVAKLIKVNRLSLFIIIHIYVSALNKIHVFKIKSLKSLKYYIQRWVTYHYGFNWCDVSKRCRMQRLLLQCSFARSTDKLVGRC